MPLILNIDTSTKFCSVALAKEGEILVGLESKEEMDHSTTLATFVNKCINYIRENHEKLDAVCVTSGPGSYTGLRIGMSLAKGLAFSLDIPMIALSSLKVLAVRAMFSMEDYSGEELIVPMIDARRMEVFTGVYNSKLEALIDEQPMILNESSFSNLQNEKKIIFIGDGSTKFKELYVGNNGIWSESVFTHAKYMVPLAEKSFRNHEFADLAYMTPRYLKEYQTSVSKSRL